MQNDRAGSEFADIPARPMVGASAGAAEMTRVLAYLRSGWVLVCLLGLAGAFLTVISSTTGQRATILLVIAAFMIGTILVSALRSRPASRWVWFSFAFGGLLLAGATILGSSRWATDPSEATNLFLLLQVTGYVSVFAGFLGAARVRRTTEDITGTLDAIILALAVGLLGWRAGFSGAVDASEATAIHTFVVSLLPALGIVVCAALLRRAFVASHTSGSFRLIFAAAVTAVVAHLVSGMTILRGSIPTHHVPVQIAVLTLLAAASVHPSMRQVTRADTVTTHKFGATRIALLALALIDAPLVILLDQGQVTRDSAPLLVGACLISVIVIVRLISLTRDLETIRQRERTRDQRFESLVQNSSDLIAVLDPDYRVTYLSPAVKDMMGFSPTELLGLNVLIGFHPDDVDRTRAVLDNLSPGSFSEFSLLRVAHRSGTWRWAEARAVNLVEDPTVGGIVVNCRDVTQRVMAQAVIDDSVARRSAVAHLGRIALAAPDARSLTERAAALVRSTLEVDSCEILLFDGNTVTAGVVATASGTKAMNGDSHPDGRVIDACLSAEDPVQFTDPNPGGPLKAETGLQFTPLEVAMDRPESIVPEDIPKLPPQVLAVQVGDRERVMGAVLIRSGASRCFGDDEASFLDTMAGTLGLALSRRRTEASARHQALHDNLTGLPNRALFVDRLTNALARIKRTDHRVAVLFMDIDHFKVVNDSLGHSVGDRILVEVADRLSTLVRPGDTVARFGGDEFTVLLDPLDPDDDPETIAQRIRTELSRTPRLGTTALQPTVSIGVAIATSQAANAETLLRDADAAMYQAKEHGRDNVAVFDDTMRDRVIHRLQTEVDLPRAIIDDQLFMRYQPIIALQDRTVSGLEALVRWRHPDLGEIPPDQFIPIAELSGLIGDLDLWVMQRVMSQCAQASRHSSAPGPWYALNISARTVAAQKLTSQVARTLVETGAPPERICVEVTESALMHDMEHSIAVLKSLRELGVGISVDDFGTGYSSLSYLKRLPATALKIDGSFIAGIEHDPRDRAIVDSVVNLARTLQMNVVAEGVETRRQLEILGDMGCPMAQGFYLGRPAAASEIAGHKIVPPGSAVTESNRSGITPIAQVGT